jgi:hypothetical protein
LPGFFHGVFVLLIPREQSAPTGEEQ